MPSQIQTTFEDVKSVRKVKALTDRQRQVLALLDQGVMQSGISRRLNITPARVCQIVSALEKKGLVKAKTQQATFEHRKYRQWFDVVPEAKIEGIKLSPIRAHNFIAKYKVHAQSGELVLDKRAGYNRSKKMKGPLRHIFWFDLEHGLPSVTVEWHIKTLLVYVNKNQTIAAKSEAEAQEIGWYAVQKAKDQFVQSQDKFGVRLDVDKVGTKISKPHGGFVMNEKGPIPKEAPQMLVDTWIDSSKTKEVGPGQYEHEHYLNDPRYTSAEKGMLAAIDVVKFMPEVMQKFGVMDSNISSIMATVQSGTTTEQMFRQSLGLISRLVEKINHMDDQIKELQSRSG